MVEVVAGLIQWSYAVWPSHAPAIVLASLTISATIAPLGILEIRSQWRIIDQASRFRFPGSDSDLEKRLIQGDLFRGWHFALILLRRVVLLAAAIVVLVTVTGLTRVDPANGGGPSYLDQESVLWHSLEQSRGEMTSGWIDLGKSVLTAGNSRTGWDFAAYLMIPLAFTTVYAVAGTRPLAGGRKIHLVVTSLIALLVPGAVVLYLFTVLLFNIGLVQLMSVGAERRRRSAEGSRGLPGPPPAAPVVASSDSRKAVRGVVQGDDFSLPGDRRHRGILLLRGGWFGCVLGVACVGVGLYLTLAALPVDLRNLTPESAIEASFPAVPLELLGMYMFSRGAEYRWMGQAFLSRTNAYRYERGFPQPTESLAALNHARAGQSRRSGIGWMAVGGLGACGLGVVGIVIGLRYLWEFAVGGKISPWDSLLPLGLGMVLMAEGNFFLRWGGRHFQRIISSPEDLVAGSYALYLRSFEEDPKLARLYRVPRPSALVRGFFMAGKTEEERLADALTWAGLPVGVGRPGERLPRVGVPRMYLPLHGWQEPVREMMRGASIVVVALGRGPGTLWELGEAMRILPPERLLLLVTMPRGEYDRCRQAVEAALRTQAETVRRKTGVRWKPPSLPDHAGRRMGTSRIRGLIYFTPAWKAVFAPLERPPILENQLVGALDRSMWSAVVQLTDYEQRTGKRHG